MYSLSRAGVYWALPMCRRCHCGCSLGAVLMGKAQVSGLGSQGLWPLEASSVALAPVPLLSRALSWRGSPRGQSQGRSEQELGKGNSVCG